MTDDKNKRRDELAVVYRQRCEQMVDGHKLMFSDLEYSFKKGWDGGYADAKAESESSFEHLKRLNEEAAGFAKFFNMKQRAERAEAESASTKKKYEWQKAKNRELIDELENWRNDAIQLERDAFKAKADRLAEALGRISKIRKLPLIDFNDTDEQIADQYSSVINTLVHIAIEALKAYRADGGRDE